MINETAGTIFKTKDYSQFKILGGNRQLNLLHLSRLENSMKSKQLIVPIIVNEKFEIIDGQHRLQAFKDLNLYVYFIVREGYGLNECQMLNMDRKNWNPDDFLNGYADFGYEEYLNFKSFRDCYKFLSMKLCQILLSGGQKSNYSHEFKEGNFKIVDFKKACITADKMYSFKNYEPFRNSHFQLALFTMVSNKQYDHDRMILKLQYQGARLTKETKVSEYLKELTEIYNNRSHNKDKVYFY